MKRFLVLLLALASLTGCTALANALPAIQSALTDTSLVLSGIDEVFSAYQATHPVTPEVRAEYSRLLTTANVYLVNGERAVSDLKQIDQGQYDAAFADFKTAFLALTDFLKAQGVTPAGVGLVGAGAAGDAFPVPRVIGLRVQS